MRFTTASVDAFARVSHDVNPLHVDRAYARTTPFGRPVVFGMAAVLKVLGAWAKGRSFRLQHLHAYFKRALFTDEEYRLVGVDADGVHKYSILRGDVVQAEISFAARFEPVAAAPAVSFTPRTEAGSELVLADTEVPYEIGATAALATEFALDAAQLPREQLDALCGASYIVGMLQPGRQAMFYDCDLVFTDAPAAGAFSFSALHSTVNAHLNTVDIVGRATGVSAMTLKALRRPLPVVHALEAVAARISASSRLAGRTAIVSGATRGFGEVIAKALLLQGARVVLNHRSDDAHTKSLARELATFGDRAIFARGDVGTADDCASIVAAAGARVDLLVLNASPTIRSLNYVEQSSGELASFVAASVNNADLLLRAALPALSPEAMLAHVSSVYAAKAPPGFSHYVAGKHAVEGILIGIAPELPRLRIVNLRLPRILTDQTNLPYNVRPPASAITVAKNALELMIETSHQPGYFSFDVLAT